MKSLPIRTIIQHIVEEFWWKKIELDYDTPFQLLCAVILSAQTTDKQVNRITPPLFAKIRNPEDVQEVSLEWIEEQCKYVNFFRNKSRYIQETGIRIANQYAGRIPNDLDIMQTLPGVGIKTAKVVLSVLYDMPYVGVDTHIHRVMNRIGIVKTKTPNETDRALEIILSEEEKKSIHHPCVLFGRYRCQARKPQCQSCKIQKWCTYYKEHHLRNREVN